MVSHQGKRQADLQSFLLCGLGAFLGGRRGFRGVPEIRLLFRLKARGLDLLVNLEDCTVVDRVVPAQDAGLVDREAAYAVGHGRDAFVGTLLAGDVGDDADQSFAVATGNVVIDAHGVPPKM